MARRASFSHPPRLSRIAVHCVVHYSYRRLQLTDRRTGRKVRRLAILGRRPASSSGEASMLHRRAFFGVVAIVAALLMTTGTALALLIHHVPAYYQRAALASPDDRDYHCREFI